MFKNNFIGNWSYHFVIIIKLNYFRYAFYYSLLLQNLALLLNKIQIQSYQGGSPEKKPLGLRKRGTKRASRNIITYVITSITRRGFARDCFSGEGSRWNLTTRSSMPKIMFNLECYAVKRKNNLVLKIAQILLSITMMT